MTLLVGIYCDNGVVIAADSAATFAAGSAPTIGQQSVQKIYKPCNHIIYAGTGAVGIAQLLSGKLGEMWGANTFANAKTPEAAMHSIGVEIGKIITPYWQLASIQRQLVGDSSASLCKSMVAVPVNKKPCLFTFDFNGAPEMASKKLPFVALGSGQPIADPFLAFLGRLLWPDRQPNVAEGRLAAAWTVDHVRRTNPGGVGGEICMSVLEPAAGAMPTITDLANADIQEHLQRIASAEQAIPRELAGIPAAAPPAPPAPPAASKT